MLLDQIDALSGQIGTLTTRIGELIAAIPAARASTPTAAPARTPDAGQMPRCCRGRRLDEVTGIGREPPRRHRRDRPAHERLPHPWAPGVLGQDQPADCPVRRKNRPGKTGKGTPTSRACWARPPPRPARPTPSSANATGAWPAAAASSKPWSPPPARSWSSSGTCSPTAAAATATSVPSYHASRIDQNRKMRNHVRQLEALGYTSTHPGCLTRPPHRLLTLRRDARTRGLAIL